MKKINSKKQDSGVGKVFALGASIAAFGAASYYFFGPKGKAHRAELKGWMLKMKAEIVEKLEGDICLVDCTKDNTECDRSTFCITREIWKKLSDDMASSLEKINLQTLVDRIRKSKNYPEYQI